MGQRANITSVEAINAFRSNLIVYLAKARPALQEVSSDVMRTKLWIQTEQRVHWEAQVRRRSRALEEAEAAVFSGRLSTLGQVTASQQLALQKAKRALAEAEDKLRVIRRWERDFENRTEPLLKEMEKLQAVFAVDMPNAVAYLTRAIATLDAYAGIAAPASQEGATAAGDPVAAPAAENQVADGKDKP